MLLQGHDSTKESKNKLLLELRKYQNRSMDASQRDNMNSNDSAIDTGEWESDSCNGSHKVVNFTKVVPRKDKIVVEQGIFVKESTLHDVKFGDRIIAISNQLSNEISLLEVQGMLEPGSCRLLRLQRMTTAPGVGQASCDLQDASGSSINEVYPPLPILDNPASLVHEKPIDSIIPISPQTVSPLCYNFNKYQYFIKLILITYNLGSRSFDAIVADNTILLY